MTALERAFQLARSGEVSGLSEIRKVLHHEGYYGNQIEGRSHLTRGRAQTPLPARANLAPRQAIRGAFVGRLAKGQKRM